MDRRATLAIACGGVLGAATRWALLEWFDTSGGWRWGTFTANVLGCAVLGIVLGRFARTVHTDVVLGITVGFCGALTTFSGFAVEIAIYIRSDDWACGVFYAAVSLLVGVAAFATAVALARRLDGTRLDVQ